MKTRYALMRVIGYILLVMGILAGAINMCPWNIFLGLGIVLFSSGLVLGSIGAENGWRMCPKLPILLGCTLGGVACAGMYPASIKQQRRETEGYTRGNLGAIRSALTIYYEDNGTYPSSLMSLAEGGKYLRSGMPTAKTPPYHPPSNAITQATKSDDSGGWLYSNVRGDAGFGGVFVNCTHTDTRGKVWTSH
ncbi:MAG: hypothetical protein WC728_03625 [Elusimicrobiota bacterium]